MTTRARGFLDFAQDDKIIIVVMLSLSKHPLDRGTSLCIRGSFDFAWNDIIYTVVLSDTGSPQKYEMFLWGIGTVSPQKYEMYRYGVSEKLRSDFFG